MYHTTVRLMICGAILALAVTFWGGAYRLYSRRQNENGVNVAGRTCVYFGMVFFLFQARYRIFFP